MQPTEWSTTYNSQFQDRRKYTSPHPGTSNPSYSVRTQGFYGSRAALAEHGARSAEAVARTKGGYDLPYNSEWEGSMSHRSQTAPLSHRSYHSIQPSTARFSNGYTTTRGGGLQLPQLNPYAYNYNSKDLWNHPIERHTGLYSNYTTIHGGVNPKSVPMRADGLVSVNDYYVDANNQNNSLSENWEQYTIQPSPRTSSSFRKYKEEKVWDNHHVPGYQGFVRGSQFTHGDTFGKTTRVCLSHPTDVPLEP